MIRKSLHAVGYLFRNPRYTAAYFLGRPEKVLEAATGMPPATYRQLRDSLATGSSLGPALREKTRSTVGENFQLGADHFFLYALTRGIKPGVILETGVFDGYFSACFLQGLRDNCEQDGVSGRLISIDLPAHSAVEESTSRIPRTTLPPGREPGWVVPDSLRERWDLHLGDSRELLAPLVEAQTEIGLFFHDSLHTADHMTYEYETAWPRIQPGSHLLSHDIHWNAAFRHFLERKGQRAFAFHGFGLLRRS